MIQLYLTRRGGICEHDAGVSLALYAIYKTFGIKTPLAYTERGKPYVESDGIYVSISHSGGLCAAAVSDGELGVDVELIASDRGSERLIKIARRFFSDDERDYVLADPSVRFWEIWTAKESFIKFTGEGLSRPLKSFSVFGGGISGINYNKFIYTGFAGCVCSLEAAKITPVFVEIDEILRADT